jgi:hypothetical protein
MNWTVQRLDSLRRLLAHVRERLGFDVGFVLWDGSTVPAQLGASDRSPSRSRTKAPSRRWCAAPTSIPSPISG